MKKIILTIIILLISTNTIALSQNCDYSNPETSVKNDMNCNSINGDYCFNISVGSNESSNGYVGSDVGDYYLQLNIDSKSSSLNHCFSVWGACYWLNNPLCKPEEDVSLDLIIEHPFVKQGETLEAKVIVYNNTLHKINSINSNSFNVEFKNEAGNPAILNCDWVSPFPSTILVGDSKTWLCNVNVPASIESGNYSLKVSLPNGLSGNNNPSNDFKKKLFTVSEEFEEINVPELNPLLIVLIIVIVLTIINFKQE